MACKHYGGEGRDLAKCGLCRVEIEIGRVFAEVEREMPRYRFWRLKRAKGKSERTFEYTTEKSLGEGDKEPERYWAIERRWVRTKRGQTGKIIRSVGFATRKKAKERALQWYQKARTPAVTAG